MSFVTDLPNGKSELDTVILSIKDDQGNAIQIKHWLDYTLTSSFLSPCDTFNFRISGPDLDLYRSILGKGAKVKISIDNNTQCTGFIEDENVSYSKSSGSIFTLSGRDILCRLTNANIDPLFQFQQSMTVEDVIAPVVSLYNLGAVYNTDDVHLNIVTGRPNNQSLTTSTTKAATTITRTDANGKALFTTNAQGQQILDRTTVYKDVTTITANVKPGLAKLPIKDYKPRPNEGAYEYIDRLIKREGLILKAVADGSGVMAISPTFTGPIDYQIINKNTLEGLNDGSSNNVLSGNAKSSWQQQPSVIICTGAAPGGEYRKAKLKVAMVNELIGYDVDNLDKQGNPTILPEIQQILDTWNISKLVPPRKELIPKQKFFNIDNAFCPMYLKDDESKDLAQMEDFVTRKMAEHQMKSLSVTYTIIGHTQKGQPWAVNTLVSVDDDIAGIHETMWVMSRTFNKSRSGGTTTTLELIRPYTLIIG